MGNNEMRKHVHRAREEVASRATVGLRASTNADPHVDWSFDVLPPHGRHEHPAPLAPARKSQLVLGQGEDEDQEVRAKFMTTVTRVTRWRAWTRVRVKATM